MKVEWKDPSDEILRRIELAARGAVEDVANELERKANETVPFDTGDLEKSSGVAVHPTEPQATVYYTLPYAPRQHDDLTLRHKPGRRARWLELAAQENADHYARYIQNEIEGA